MKKFLGKNKKILAISLFLLITIGFFISNFHISHAGSPKDCRESYTFGNQCICISPPDIDCYGNPRKVGDPIGRSPHADGNLFSDAIIWLIKQLLLIILFVVSWLLSVANSVFVWASHVEIIEAVLNSRVLYEAWAKVRDILNLFFIMMLLFTAFGIIFQVDKLGNKKTILTIVLMALLINFSFPITRFIIDASNVMMYSFIKKTFESKSDQSIADIANKSDLQKLISDAKKANTSSEGLAFLVMTIIFVFMFSITILTLGVLLIIRVVALGFLIVISPVAYVGSFVSVLKKYASQWWDMLLKYSFFGPIMIFMLWLSLELAKIVVGDPTFAPIAGENASNTPLKNLIIAGAKLSIPIITLWMGMGLAQKLSIMGAGWAAAKVGGLPLKGIKGGSSWLWKKTGVPGGIKKKWEHWKKSGKLFGSDAVAQREARFAGAGPFAVPHATDEANAKKTKEIKEKLDIGNMVTGDLSNLAKNGNKYEKAAAIEELAIRGRAGVKDLDSMRAAFGETSQVFKLLANKVREYDPVASFAHITNDADRLTRMQEHVNSNKFDLKKLGLNSLSDAEFVENLLANNDLSIKDITEFNKDPEKKQALNKALKDIVDPSKLDRNVKEDVVSQKAHLGLFAQTGEVSNPDFTEHIFRNVNDESIANITPETAQGNALYMAMYSKNYKKLINGMKSDASKLNVNRQILDITDDDIRMIGDPVERLNVEGVVRTARKDPQLRNLK